MSLAVVAREVWTPPAPKKAGKADGPLRCSGHAEAALARAKGCWVVLWKTPAMSSTAFSYYDALTEAWPLYVQHRTNVRLLSSPKHDERAWIECEISLLQERLASL